MILLDQYISLDEPCLRLLTGVFCCPAAEGHEERKEGGEVAGEEDGEGEAADDSEMPPGFLSDCKGNRVKALKRWAVTKKWREEQRVDRVLLEPHRTFPIIKQFYPHFLHGTTKEGELVMYELAGA
jgi:hypothetical protein